MLNIGKTLTAEQRLYKATTDIIGRDEFVALAGVLMIGSKKVVDDVPTACTNGKDEMYGRAFVDKLSDAEFRFVMLHECYHKMYRHLSTWQHLNQIDSMRTNQACDYVINLKLANTDAYKSQWIKMPQGGLMDSKYTNMNTEQVFKLLEDSGDDGQGQGQGKQGDGQGFDEHDWAGAKELSGDEAEALAREIDEAVRQGAIMAGKMGTGGLRDLKDLLEPKKDWRELLRDFVSTTCAGKDYSTWRKPNRRYIGYNMLMPSSISESIGEIVVAIDTSGSIGERELRAFLSEVKGICDSVKPSKVRVLYWDTEVCGHEVYNQDELDNLPKATKPKGGGGTMVECVPSYMNEHGIKPECVVVLTDGHLGNSWGAWSVPLIWCIQGNKRATPNVGVAVHID
jgi:predicted metal-dependent peptidase